MQHARKTRVYMKKGLKERERESVNEIPLAPDMDHWQIYVNMVINLQVLDKVVGFFTTRTMITLFGNALLHELSELLIQFHGHQTYRKGPLPHAILCF